MFFKTPNQSLFTNFVLSGFVNTNAIQNNVKEGGGKKEIFSCFTLPSKILTKN